MTAPCIHCCASRDAWKRARMSREQHMGAGDITDAGYGATGDGLCLWAGALLASALHLVCLKPHITRRSDT
jgi:hypothetical protein